MDVGSADEEEADQPELESRGRNFRLSSSSSSSCSAKRSDVVAAAGGGEGGGGVVLTTRSFHLLARARVSDGLK